MKPISLSINSALVLTGPKDNKSEFQKIKNSNTIISVQLEEIDEAVAVTTSLTVWCRAQEANQVFYKIFKTPVSWY